MNIEPDEKLQNLARERRIKKIVIISLIIFFVGFLITIFATHKDKAVFTYKSVWTVKDNGDRYGLECHIISLNQTTKEVYTKYADIVLSEIIMKDNVYDFYKKNINERVKVPDKYWHTLKKDGVKQVYLDNIYRKD